MARCAPVVLSLSAAPSSAWALAMLLAVALGVFLAEVRVASHHLPLTGRKD